CVVCPVPGNVSLISEVSFFLLLNVSIYLPPLAELLIDVVSVVTRSIATYTNDPRVVTGSGYFQAVGYVMRSGEVHKVFIERTVGQNTFVIRTCISQLESCFLCTSGDNYVLVG